MSSYVSYEDAPVRRRKSERDRRSGRGTKEYVEEETYMARGTNNAPRQMSLVQRRRDDSPDSIEEVQRDFPPGDGGYVRRKTTVRESGRRARSASGRDTYARDRDYDDGYGRRTSEYSGRSRRESDDKRSRKSRRYSSSSESSPEPRHRRKSMSEQVVAALGLGGAAAALTGKKSKDSRSRSRDRGDRSRSRGGRDRRRHSSSSSRSRSRGGGDKSNEKIGQALKAAITAGAAEAFRARKEPGGWGGQKGKRILTAAIAAGGVDGLVDRDPDKHSKRHVLGSALAGLATTRVINGPRSQSRGRARSESRGRDGGGSGLEKLAGAGGVAALGKMAYDRMRSKSRDRSRGRGRSSSGSSYDSRRGPPAQRKRSQSVSDYVNKGLAAVGLKEAADTRDDRRHRDYEDDYSYRSSRGAPRGGGGSRDFR